MVCKAANEEFIGMNAQSCEFISILDGMGLSKVFFIDDRLVMTSLWSQSIHTRILRQ